MIPFSSQQYESVDTFLLLQEFYAIPNNPISFEVPPGMVITTGMVHTFIKAAYCALGKPILELNIVVQRKYMFIK